jgi:hypothetical protein
MLTLVLSTCLSYAGQYMRNLSENFIDDLEALLKKTRTKLKNVLALELEDHRIRRNLTP